MSKHEQILPNDPLFHDNPNRLVLLPIQNRDAMELYELQLSSFWHPNEIYLSEDQKHFEELSPGIQKLIKTILAFFASSDAIVNENIVLTFLRDIKQQEWRLYYGIQYAIENIHNQVYSNLIDTLIKDEQEKLQLLHAAQTMKCVKAKTDWALRVISGMKKVEGTDEYIANQPKNEYEAGIAFAEKVVGFLAVEGVFFSGSFAPLFFIRTKRKMPGLTFSNELISADENLHTRALQVLYGQLVIKLPETRVHEIFKEAVDLEKMFQEEALELPVLGLSHADMKQYTEYVADYQIQPLGVSKIYNAKNPFPFMTQCSLRGKTNFFERRVGEYAKFSMNKRAKLEESDDFDPNVAF